MNAYVDESTSDAGKEFCQRVVQLIQSHGMTCVQEHILDKLTFHGQRVRCDIFVEDMGICGAVVEVKYQDSTGSAFEKIYAAAHKYEGFPGNVYVVLGGVEAAWLAKELQTRHVKKGYQNMWFMDYGGLIKRLQSEARRHA